MALADPDMAAVEDGASTATLQEMVDDADQLESGEDALAFELEALRGLREISALANWNVSTHKPGCGVAALLAPTPHAFWQSDGPQPHFLTLHFFKIVAVVRLRLYLDFVLDESYTPTRIEFWAGWTGSYGLVHFADWTGPEPRGWQDISLDGAGVGGRAELRCMVLQVRIIENHQNGKDTHLRGMQVFAADERDSCIETMGVADDVAREGLVEPEWMREPQLR